MINKLNYNNNLIINITNDIWFGKFLGPYQHLYLAKLRAAEFNKKLVRVSNNGISAIIDEKGSLLSFIDLNDKKSIRYNLTINQNDNFYITHYLLNIYLLVIILLIFIYYIKKVHAR